MTGTIDITCSLPAPTLAQVRAWLVRTGWEEDPSHRGKRSTVWWHTSALHPRGGREGLGLTKGGIAETITHAAHALTRIRGTKCTPEAVYREIMRDMTPATDCLVCPKCSVPCGAPALSHPNCRDAYSDDMCCRACGHEWREDDIDKCVQAWRAEVAYDKSMRAEVQK